MADTTYDLPLQTAVDWTTAWRAAHVNVPNYVKAFRVDVNEIQEILQEAGTDYIRLYFGIDGTTEKLILVAVDEYDNDIINPTVNGHVKSGTYDFTNPCPPTCDDQSPLMTGRMPG